MVLLQLTRSGATSTQFSMTQSSVSDQCRQHNIVINWRTRSFFVELLAPFPISAKVLPATRPEPFPVVLILHLRYLQGRSCPGASDDIHSFTVVTSAAALWGCVSLLMVMSHSMGETWIHESATIFSLNQEKDLARLITAPLSRENTSRYRVSAVLNGEDHVKSTSSQMSYHNI